MTKHTRKEHNMVYDIFDLLISNLSILFFFFFFKETSEGENEGKETP